MENIYLLGHPIGHSKSPAMQNAAYQHLGLPWYYEPADLETEDAARTFLDRQKFFAVNITTPYKPLALAASTNQASSAKLAQGANLLINHKDALIAFNTDGQGCVSYLERTGFNFAGSSVVVCGSGPTALAIYHACVVAGAKEVLMVGRDRDRTMEVVDSYVERYERLILSGVDMPPAQDHHLSLKRAFVNTTFKFGSYSTSKQGITAADLVINATPLGMNPGDPAPFDVTLFREGQQAFDVVYGHGTTAFMQGARDAGCVVHDGAGMLVAQAVVCVEALIDIAQAQVSFDPLELFDVMAKAAHFTEL